MIEKTKQTGFPEIRKRSDDFKSSDLFYSDFYIFAQQ